MASIKDVAKKANVSIGTIDRVVHNRGRVAEKTIEKVRKIINDLDYKPNVYAKHLSLSKTYKIAVLMPELDETGFWKMSLNGIEKAVEELEPYNVKVNYFFYDRSRSDSFLNESRKVIDMLPDGILAAPVITRLASEFFQKIPAEVPYVLFDTNVPDIRALSFIGQNSFQSGMVCGRLMDLLLSGKKGSVAVIMVLDDYHIQERAEGFKNFFYNNERIKVYSYGIDDTSGSNSFYKMMDIIIESHPDLEGIFVTNCHSHYVVEYLKEKNIEKKLSLIGYDLTNENIKYLEEGLISFLINQKPEMQGYEGLFALYRHLALQQNCPGNITMPIEIITKENLVINRP